MTFKPENDLERALMRAAGEPAARPEFYRLLLASDLIVIGETEHPAVNDKIRISAGENLKITGGEMNGKHFLPIFSSLPRLQSYIREHRNYVALNGQALLEITQGAFLILNPGSEYGKELLPDEVAGLLNPEANKPQKVVAEQGTQVLIGQPAVYPHDLVNALKAVFAEDEKVISAHLVQIAFPDAKQAPHPLIGIETKGDWDGLASKIGKTAVAAAPGMLFDVMQIDSAKPNGLGKSLLEAPSFYQRKKSFWQSILN